MAEYTHEENEPKVLVAAMFLSNRALTRGMWSRMDKEKNCWRFESSDVHCMIDTVKARNLRKYRLLITSRNVGFLVGDPSPVELLVKDEKVKQPIWSIKVSSDILGAKLPTAASSETHEETSQNIRGSATKF